MNVYRVKLYIDIEADDEDDAIDRVEGALYGSDIPPYRFLSTEDMGPTVLREGGPRG